MAKDTNGHLGSSDCSSALTGDGVTMDTITADAARQITADNLRGPAIESLVSTLTQKIKMLASEGKSSFDPWLYLGSLRGIAATIEQREAIKVHFIKAGFKWEDHPDPDQGHPASRSYTTLSW